MFKYKTSAELEKMTDDQRDTYMEQKKIHEDAELQKSIDTKVAAIKEDLEKGFVSKEEAEKAAKDAVDTAKAELMETLKVQGDEITALKSAKGTAAKENLLDAFKEQYDALDKMDGEIPKEAKITIDVTKVSVSSDVLTATTVSSGQFPTAGGTRAVDASIGVINAQNLGFASYRKPYSHIMEAVDVMPLTGQNLLIVNETVTGDAAVTPECTLKPIVKLVYTTQQAEAVAIAAEWATTTQLRKFYPNITNRMERKIAELVMDKTPASVLAAVVAGGTAFTPNPALAINTDPNNYDALGAAIAQLENLGYVPNAIVLNPIAYRNMIQEKNAEGIYSLWNGNAISLVGEYGLAWGGRVIRWILDPTIAVDRFIVGDLNYVKVGLDNELMYFETDGRTDVLASSVSGLSRNIRTHVMERFVATLIPTSNATAILTDTFANVKTLITAE